MNVRPGQRAGGDDGWRPGGRLEVSLTALGWVDGWMGDDAPTTIEQGLGMW